MSSRSTPPWTAAASATTDERTRSPVVVVQFTDQGADRLKQVTTLHTDRLMAVVVGNQVHIAANIREPVSGGRMQLSMSLLEGLGRRQQKAWDLAKLLRAQFAPVELEF